MGFWDTLWTKVNNVSPAPARPKIAPLPPVTQIPSSPAAFPASPSTPTAPAGPVPTPTKDLSLEEFDTLEALHAKYPGGVGVNNPLGGKKLRYLIGSADPSVSGGTHPIQVIPVPPQIIIAQPAEPDPGVPYAADYRSKWNSMQVPPSRQAEVSSIAKGILIDKTRYLAIERITNVPWYLIGALHNRESGRDFTTYLGNGEPLNRRTTIEPAGRGPFSSFEAGAIDALKYDGLDKFTSWPVARICYECEKFNGMGYQRRGVPSPYLWSFSNIYKGGKYTSDGVYSSGVVDQQCGVMPVIAKLMELDSSIKIERATNSPPVVSGSDTLTRQQFAYSVLKAMQAKGYRVDTELGQKNIVYVEGWTRNADDTFVRNSDQPDLFNDLRCVFDRDAVLLGAYQATTRPGKYYTENRLNSGGAANIVPGQYQAWEIGLHRGLYEALVQRGTLKVARDDNEDYSRTDDKVETGDYEGINQHHGSDADTIGPHSAGCLVGRFVHSHEEFCATVKTDPRYKVDHAYRFWTAVLERDDIQ